jgi:hypothetical protein
MADRPGGVATAVVARMNLTALAGCAARSPPSAASSGSAGPVAEAGAWVAAVTREGQELRFTHRHGHASLLP